MDVVWELFCGCCVGIVLWMLCGNCFVDVVWELFRLCCVGIVLWMLCGNYFVDVVFSKFFKIFKSCKC